MNRSARPPRRRPGRKPAGRRRPGSAAVPCSCHTPLPPLPRSLQAREVAYGRRFGRPWWRSVSYTDAPPLTAADLDTDARGRLLGRAETRYRRLRAGERHAHRDWYGIETELRLILPDVHPKVVRRWRDRVRWAVHHAEWRLDALRKLEAFVLQHEPETDAWLRRQLAGLDGRRT